MLGAPQVSMDSRLCSWKPRRGRPPTSCRCSTRGLRRPRGLRIRCLGVHFLLGRRCGGGLLQMRGMETRRIWQGCGVIRRKRRLKGEMTAWLRSPGCLQTTQVGTGIVGATIRCNLERFYISGCWYFQDIPPRSSRRVVYPAHYAAE